MTATDVAPTRLEAAKSASSSFLDKVPDRFRVGLVSFSSIVSVLEEPTDDRDAVRDALDTLEGDVGTALGDAIVESVALAPDPEEAEELSGGKPLFAILLLSDGANSIGARAARRARRGEGGRRPDLHDRVRHAATAPSRSRTTSASPRRTASRPIRRP